MPDPILHESADQQGTLEEIVSPLEGGGFPPQLAAETVIASEEGGIRIAKSLGRNGAINVYAAVLEHSGQNVCLREAFDSPGAQSLRREAEILRGLSRPMFPRIYSCFDWENRTVLVSELVDGQTFADAVGAGDLGFSQALPVLTQVAFAIGQLHEAGWVHLGLRPSSVLIGKPAKVVDFRYISRIGTKPDAVYFHSGYSAPELLNGDCADPRSDVFSIGALLYHALTRHAVSETGPELTSLTPDVLTPGISQILSRCLCPLEVRFPTANDLHRALVRLARRIRPILRHNCTGLTTIGLEPSRTTNQDAYGYISGNKENEDASGTWTLLAVADGMGGMEAGEVASTTAVNAILRAGTAVLTQESALSAERQSQIVSEWVKVANLQVCEALDSLQVRGGSTLICALVCGSRLAIGHVGDCRIYLVRNGEWQLLSRDHSFVMTLVAQGQIAMSDIRKHPERSNVTRSLGDRKSVPDYYIDTLQQVTGAPVLELHSGDVLLVCTDGLWEPVEEDEMTAALTRNPTDLRAAAKELISAALRNGGPDNATAVLMRVDQ